MFHDEHDSQKRRRRRPTIVVEYEGVPMSLRELSQRTGIPHSSLVRRYRNGRRGESLIAPPDARKQHRGRWG